MKWSHCLQRGTSVYENSCRRLQVKSVFLHLWSLLLQSQSSLSLSIFQFPISFRLSIESQSFSNVSYKWYIEKEKVWFIQPTSNFPHTGTTHLFDWLRARLCTKGFPWNVEIATSAKSIENKFQQKGFIWMPKTHVWCRMFFLVEMMISMFGANANSS